MENYHIGDGCLVLKPTAIKITDDMNSPTFAAVRQMDFVCVTEISFLLDTEQTGDEAGVAIYLTPDFMYRIFKRREEAGDYIVVQKVADDLIQTACHKKITDGIIHVRIRADRHSYTFYYAVNDGEMHCACSASTRFLACELAGKCFTGTVIGVYAQAEKRTDAVAKYYRFRQKRTKEGGRTDEDDSVSK